MRTIESPGVEIREIDYTQNTPIPNGTSVLAVGYTSQGPTDELVNITSITEYEQVFGQPSNSAERYHYHTCKQILQANGNLMVTRLPYGSGSGSGYTSNYSALVFPTFPYNSNVTDYATGISGFNITSTIASGVTGLGDFGTYSVYHNVTASGNGNYVGHNLETLTVTVSSPVASVAMALSNGILTPTTSYYTSAYSGTFTKIDDEFDQYKWTISTPSLVSGANITLTTNVSTASAATVAAFTDSSSFYIGQPTHITIDEATYYQWQQGGINWRDGLIPASMTATQYSVLSSVGYAGFILVNEYKTAIDETFAGYYIALADNSKTDKGSNFDSVNHLKTINSSTAAAEWLELNTDRLGFALSGSFTEHAGSISEIVETIPSWDFSNTGAGGYNDSIILTMFKVRPTLYNAEDRVLDMVLAESYVGSFDATRTINNQQGGQAESFYIENIVNNNSNTLRMFVNPNISRNSGVWFNQQTGLPTKKVRIASPAKPNTDPYGVALTDNATNPAEPHGKASVVYTLGSTGAFLSNADSMYGIGEYVPCGPDTQKYIGNLPEKLERALRLVENRETTRLDVVAEAGLGTVWTGMRLDMNNWPAGALSPSTSTQTAQIFDDTVYINGIVNAHTFDVDSDGLLSQANGSSSEAQDHYETVFNIFNTFCQTTRQDCLYVADPLRYIFVQGNGDVKVINNPSLNFSQHIYWPLKNLYGGVNTSYACTFTNWIKVYDASTSRNIWVPGSGFIANTMIKTDTTAYPWYAPAGLNRGVLSGALDIAINPTQKQRDLLYKSGLNAIVYWPGDGYVIWGQKTLLSKPSAFDRINVRRLFLWLEKGTLPILRYFVFENNTVFTRNRVRSAITPLLDFAKNNEGVYDYKIVCDTSNNTPDVIDRNELIVSIYIKPVRVAEFILAKFIATRTGQNFEEIV